MRYAVDVWKWTAQQGAAGDMHYEYVLKCRRIYRTRKAAERYARRKLASDYLTHVRPAKQKEKEIKWTASR